jgi:hypothetical protein
VVELAEEFVEQMAVGGGAAAPVTLGSFALSVT